MKKLLSILITLACLSLFSACQSSSDSLEPSSTTTIKSYVGKVELAAHTHSDSYEWSFVSTPENKEKRLFNSDQKEAFFTANTVGQYVISLKTPERVVNYTVEVYDTPEIKLTSPLVYSAGYAISYSHITEITGSFKGELTGVSLLPAYEEIIYDCNILSVKTFQCPKVNLKGGDNAFTIRSKDILGKIVDYHFIITRYTKDIFLTLPALSQGGVEVNETQNLTARIKIAAYVDENSRVELIKEGGNGDNIFVAEMTAEKTNADKGETVYKTSFDVHSDKQRVEIYRVMVSSKTGEEIMSLPVTLTYFIHEIDNFDTVAKTISNHLIERNNKITVNRTILNTDNDLETEKSGKISNNDILDLVKKLEQMDSVEGVAINDSYLYIKIKNSPPHIITLDEKPANYDVQIDRGISPASINHELNRQVLSQEAIPQRQAVDRSTIYTYLPAKSGLFNKVDQVVDKNKPIYIGNKNVIFLSTADALNQFDLLATIELFYEYNQNKRSDNDVKDGSMNKPEFTVQSVWPDEVTVHDFADIGNYGVIVISAHGWDIATNEINRYQTTAIQVESYTRAKFKQYINMYYNEGRQYFYGLSSWWYYGIQHIGITDQFISDYATWITDEKGNREKGFAKSFIFLGLCNSSMLSFDNAGAIMAYTGGVGIPQNFMHPHAVIKAMLQGKTSNEAHSIAKKLFSSMMLGGDLVVRHPQYRQLKFFEPEKD